MISGSLGSSRKFHALLGKAGKLGEFAQALYPLIVAHSDDFGRLEGDAFTIKHKVFPSSPRTEEDFRKVIQAMNDVGLVHLYTVDDVRCIQVGAFEPHQSGLHKRTKSRFPEPPGDSGNFPEIPSEEKGREENLTEEEGKGTEGAPRSRPPTPSKEELVAELKEKPAFKDLDVEREYDKAAVWCEANNREPTKKFFVNWLNGADRHPKGNGAYEKSSNNRAGHSQPLANPIPKPKPVASG